MAIEILVSSKANNHKEWIIVENYSSLAELEEECREVGPDFVIKGYEPRLNQIEIVNPEMAWFINQDILRAERDGNIEAFNEYIEVFGEVDYDNHLKTFVGTFDSYEEVAIYLCEEKGYLNNVPDFIREEIDWEEVWTTLSENYLDVTDYDTLYVWEYKA